MGCTVWSDGLVLCAQLLHLQLARVMIVPAFLMKHELHSV